MPGCQDGIAGSKQCGGTALLNRELSVNCREVCVIYVLLIINVCYLFYNMQYHKKSYNT